MIKRLLTVTTLATTLSVTTTTIAQDIGTNNYNEMNQNIQNLSQLLRNLGGYLGYNISQKPSNINSDTIENANQLQLAYGLAVSVMVGARPVDSLMKTLAPSSISGMEVFNQYANAVYSNPEYNTAKTDQGSVTANSLIDQTTYQQDPITQAVLNIMATPDDSYCVQNDGSLNQDCTYLTQGQVTINGIGTLPNPGEFFSYSAVESLLPQLTFNSLTGPLVYNVQASNQSPTSSPLPSTGQNKGLQTLSQAQAAQNFIVNASGTLYRPALPTYDNYSSLYDTATSTSATGSTTTPLERMAAQKTLSVFMSQLRTYAAQISVGISNLYFSLAKRMPQNPANAQNPTSQALAEFQMATYRLFQPDGSQNNTQWLQKINSPSTSSATVQKEIAILLAEINYQLYLNRQIQERNLLTNSITLINSVNNLKPDGQSLTSSATTSDTTLIPSSSGSGS